MPSKTAPTRIQLINTGRHEEGVADGTITPGMLIQLDAAGHVVPHNTATGPAEYAFALEDALQGRTIADNYVSGELVQIGQQQPGDVIYAWLRAGETVTPADFLTSDGTGRLKKASGTHTRLSVPLETLDLTGSGHDHTRIRVRLL